MKIALDKMVRFGWDRSQILRLGLLCSDFLRGAEQMNLTAKST